MASTKIYNRDVDLAGDSRLVKGDTVLIDSNGKIIESAGIEIADGDAFEDTNSNEILEFTVTASAVNHVGISNTGTGVSPVFIAEGEANTGFTFVNSEAEEVLILDSIASSVNELTISSAATGSGPILAATGDDTNVDVNINPKGTGSIISTSTEAGVTGAGLVLYQNSASPASMDALGVITFRGKDDGGNVTDYATLTGILADPTGGAEMGGLLLGGQDQSGSASNWMSITREGTDVKLSAFNGGDSVTIDTDSSGDINLSPAGSGQLVVNKPIVLSSTETIAAGGTSTAMDLKTTTSYVDSDAGGDVFTLADGTDGQQKTVIMASATGTATITPTNFTGGTSVTVATAGATATFQFSTAAGGWVLIGESAATVI